MDIDLFSVFVDGGASWGVGRILDVLISCPNCGDRRETDIGNAQKNYLDCRNCHVELEQFTNACDLTVNRTSRQIGHAAFRFRGSNKYFWKSPDLISEIFSNKSPKERLSTSLMIRTEGLKGRSVTVATAVVNGFVGSLDEDEYKDSIMNAKDNVIGEDYKVLAPKHNDSVWENISFELCSRRSFRKNSEYGPKTLLGLIISEDQDILALDKFLIDP